jgi:ribonuclease P protein component
VPKGANGSPLITTDGISLRADWPRSVRLRNPREFRAVYERGRRQVSRSFVVFILPTDTCVTRFGLTTPKKLGNAHERNRIRRRDREVLRQDAAVRSGPGIDVVINPRRRVLTSRFGELRQELLDLLGESA